MAIPFLQGLTKAMDMLEHDLEKDAEGLTIKIQQVHARGKTAITKGHGRIDNVAGRVGEVEKFVTAIEGSNGGVPLSGSSNSSGASLNPGEPPKPEAGTIVVNSEEVGSAAALLAEPAASWGAKT